MPASRWFSLLLFTAIFSAAAAEIPAIIVFGDSSVDSGNNNVIATVLKSNFKPYGRDFDGGRPTGRFCNGRIPPDYISAAFGLKSEVPAYLDPNFSIADFATGVCFASAGTGYDNATAKVLNVIPLWKELEYYKEYQNRLKAYAGERKAKHILRQALYLISLGTNDFLENYYTFPTRRLQFTIEQYSDFLVGLARDFLSELYALGAQKMSFTGVPPLGCLPLERATNFFDQHECNKEYNDVGTAFNRKLFGLVEELNKELPGLHIVFADPSILFYDIIRRPSLYGFEVAAVACCSTGTFEMSYLCNQHNPFTCTDADKYVFWDAFHPTEKTNKLLSDHLIPRLLATFH